MIRKSRGLLGRVDLPSLFSSALLSVPRGPVCLMELEDLAFGAANALLPEV